MSKNCKNTKKSLTKEVVGDIIIGHLRVRRVRARRLKYFFRKLKKVLDLWRKLCYINQAVGDDGEKDREAECTL